jgi:hypothetical protein
VLDRVFLPHSTRQTGLIRQLLKTAKRQPTDGEPLRAHPFLFVYLEGVLGPVSVSVKSSVYVRRSTTEVADCTETARNQSEWHGLGYRPILVTTVSPRYKHT